MRDEYGYILAIIGAIAVILGMTAGLKLVFFMSGGRF